MFTIFKISYVIFVKHITLSVLNSMTVYLRHCYKAVLEAGAETLLFHWAMDVFHGCLTASQQKISTVFVNPSDL
jgi:hypothetical protein